MTLLSILITILIITIFLAILANLYQKEKRKVYPWQKLAESNQLTFVPGTIYNQRTFIFGDYQGHHLVLDTFHKNLGRQATIYTRLVLFAELAKDPETKQPIPTVQHTLTQLIKIHSEYSIKAPLTIQLDNQTLYYEQPGFEEDVEYLHSLFHFMSDVADIYPAVLAIGGETVTTLQTLITGKNQALKFVATELLNFIAKETTSRLKPHMHAIFCLDCLVSVAPHKIQKVTYYGCRSCGQSREFFERRIVAILDQDMGVEQLIHKNVLRVNWLIRRNLFDFDEVEIVQASDEEVERFAVQVGNDTDSVRRPKYKKMQCLVSSNCNLTENTRRILQHMFGEVIDSDQSHSIIE